MSARAGVKLALVCGKRRSGDSLTDPTQRFVFLERRGPSLARMNSPTQESRAEAIALARFSLISRIQELVRTPVPLKVALDTVASSAVLELQGQSQPVARRTLEDWWYA